MLVGSAVAGTGLVVGYSGLPLGSSTGARDALAAGTFNHQLFLTMDSSGTATVHITKAEIGQHIGTAYPVLGLDFRRCVYSSAITNM